MCVFLFVCFGGKLVCKTRIWNIIVCTSANECSCVYAAWCLLVFIRAVASCKTVQMVYVSCQLSDGAPLF